ncbi:tetraacyldisaccharide 4'-kinase [Bdellovibrio sp. HCB337]|uniref:tetraacyldisaccharide 4'-kinase n=1 Tax=Bdellovibrio sp. HCB337 TaxID=3394358 RepID=UPI0039A73B89
MSGLKPLSFLYKKVAGLKNYLYDHDYVTALEMPIPVLALGNITMGGTGKTPVTDFCLKYFQRRRVKVAVVSRNYKALVSEAAQVNLDHENAAAYFGDEPVLLAQRNPQTDFFVGPVKFETAQLAVEKVSPQVIVVDDGFQHRQLYRDVDIVILDATEPLENYECVPLGRARESWESLARATAFVVSKVNLAQPAAVDALCEKLKEFGKPIVPMSYELMRLLSIRGGPEKSLKGIAGQPVLLLSGIAQPSSFEKSLEKFSLEKRGHLVYKDHHPYSQTDIAEILEKWQKAGSPDIVTTEKDFVKLRPLWPDNVPLWYAPLEVRILSQEDEFYEILDQVLH